MSAPAALTRCNLALPRLSADVPASYDIWGAGNGDAQIAKALLDAGILTERDWNGDLHGSMQQGLARWANETCGCCNINWLHLCVTSSIEAWYQDGDSWITHFSGMALPVGAVAIENDAMPYYYVERAVREWEARHKGLGWTLLYAAEYALFRTINVASPSWAVNLLEEMWWQEEEEDDTGDDPDREEGDDYEDNGFITKAKLKASVPQEIIRFNTQGRPLSDALKTDIASGLRKRSLTEMERALLTDAQELCALLDRAEDSAEFGDQHCCFPDHEQQLAVGIRWNEDDRVPEIVDMYMNNMINSGQNSTFVHLRGFQIGNPARTVAQAVENLGLTLQIVGKAARILEALNGDPKPLPAPVRKAEGKPLVEIFKAEQDTPDSEQSGRLSSL